MKYGKASIGGGLLKVTKTCDDGIPARRSADRRGQKPGIPWLTQVTSALKGRDSAIATIPPQATADELPGCSNGSATCRGISDEFDKSVAECNERIEAIRSFIAGVGIAATSSTSR